MTGDVEVVIVGGGPAGLSAALVLGRARRSVLVLDTDRPRNACSPSVHGFLTRDGAGPAEFLTAARADVDRYGVERLDAEAVSVRRGPTGLTVELADGRTVTARHVVAATGLTDHLPEVAGLAERWGRDVLHCPYCHGYEVRDEPVVTIADDAEGAVHQALLLRQWTARLTLLLDGVEVGDLTDHDRRLLRARGIAVTAGRAEAVLTEEDDLTGLRLADGSVLSCSAVFVPLRLRVNDAALGALGAEVSENPMGTCLATDSEGRTSVPHLWAVGNLADLSAQVLTAAESGASAAIAINGELSLTDAEDALAATTSPDEVRTAP